MSELSFPVTSNSMPTVTIAGTTSPVVSSFSVTGSPATGENATYDVSFFNERGRLNRILKKR